MRSCNLQLPPIYFPRGCPGPDSGPGSLPSHPTVGVSTDIADPNSRGQVTVARSMADFLGDYTVEARYPPWLQG